MAAIKKTKSSSKTSIGRIAIVVVFIAIVSGGYLYVRRTPEQPPRATNGESLQTAKATVGNLVLFAGGTGTVKPAAESSFGFNTSGQVSAIDVRVGDQVEAGQVLAQLDDTYAKISLAQAQEAMDKLTSAAAVAGAEQALASAQSDFVNAKKTLEYLISPEVLYWEEKVSEREQILADAKAANQSDPSDAAKQKVTDAETSLKYAQDSLAHFQEVYEHDYIPAIFTQYRTVRTRRGTRTEVIKVEDEKTGELVDLIYPPTEAEIGMARADYQLAKATSTEAQTYLDVLNGADVPNGATGADLVNYIQTKHALETAEYNLNATKLIAPINGTVTALDIDVGDLVASQGEVVTVSNLDQPYYLDAYLDAEDWGQAQVGYEVDATFDILPDQVFKGTVTEIYPTLDTSSSNSALVHFTARLNDTIPYELPSGSTASMEVIGGRAENVVLVPVEALHQFGDGKYALFVVENDKLRLRVVQVGLKDLTKAEIISGVSAGNIVTTGVVKIK